MPPKERIDGADLLRAVAVLGVVAIHSSAWPYTGTTLDYKFWTDVNQIVRFSVPIFVVMTGMLLSYTYRQRVQPVDFFKRRFSRSLLPWIVWAPIYFVVDWFLTGEFTHGSSVFTWLTYGAGHLYFLILVPQFYLLFVFWPRSSRGAVVAAVVAMLIQETLSIFRLYAHIPTDTAEGQLLLWRAYTLFPFWIGYFGVGVAVGRYVQTGSTDRPKLAAVFAVLIPVFAVLLLARGFSNAPNGAHFSMGTSAFLTPLLPLFVFAIFGAGLFGGTALLRSSSKLRAVISTLSLYSLGIYITHEMWVHFLGVALTPILEQNVPGSIAGWLLLMTGSLVMGLLITRLIVATPLAVTVGQKRIPLRRRAAKRQE